MHFLKTEQYIVLRGKNVFLHFASKGEKCVSVKQNCDTERKNKIINSRHLHVTEVTASTRTKIASKMFIPSPDHKCSPFSDLFKINSKNIKKINKGRILKKLLKN